MKHSLIDLIKTYISFGLLVGYIFFVAMPRGWWSTLLPGDLEARKRRFHRAKARFFHFYTFHGVFGQKAEVRNPYHETFEQPALLIANHQSLLDLPATLMLHDKIVAMTGQWVWDSAIYGKVIRFADFFPATMPMDNMLRHIQDCMRRGYSVLIFPEGTRSEDCAIHTFRRGAFHLAEQLQCDIVPITLWGTGHNLPKLDFCLRPGRAVIEVGPRHRYADGLMGTTHSEMTRFWHKWFVARYAALQNELAPKA